MLLSLGGAVLSRKNGPVPVLLDLRIVLRLQALCVLTQLHLPLRYLQRLWLQQLLHVFQLLVHQSLLKLPVLQSLLKLLALQSLLKLPVLQSLPKVLVLMVPHLLRPQWLLQPLLPQQLSFPPLHPRYVWAA
jgi:hypothetical protein